MSFNQKTREMTFSSKDNVISVMRNYNEDNTVFDIYIENSNLSDIITASSDKHGIVGLKIMSGYNKSLPKLISIHGYSYFDPNTVIDENPVHILTISEDTRQIFNTKTNQGRCYCTPGYDISGVLCISSDFYLSEYSRIKIKKERYKNNDNRANCKNIVRNE